MANISFKNVVKTYDNGVTVIPDLNLEIKDKEFVVLVGPSGCGKSTTLRMIAGLESITEGELYIGDRLVNDVAPKDRDIAMVFQSYALYPHMTVYRNMAFALELRKEPKDEIDRKVREAAKILDLEKYLDRKPKALSGGQRQRVALGRAMVRNPAVFLLDEPLSNLDAKLRTEMRTQISALHKRLETTFVYVTHDQLEAMTLSTKICLMKNGVLQQYANPLEVYRNPANTFTADFVGSPNINLLNFTLKDMTLKNSDGLTLKIAMCDNSKVNDQDVILGLRPEYVQISNEGSVKGEIYSSLPSGMETIVKVKIGSIQLNSVIFGDGDFTVGDNHPIAFPGIYNLFDKDGNRIGRCKIISASL